MAATPTITDVSTPYSTAMYIDWTSETGAEYYKIYRSEDDITYDLLHSTEGDPVPTTSEYWDKLVAPSTLYYYKVSSVESDVESSLSTSDSGTTAAKDMGKVVLGDSSVLEYDQNKFPENTPEVAAIWTLGRHLVQDVQFSATAEGSYRQIEDAGDLVVQQYISGTWTTIATLSGPSGGAMAYKFIKSTGLSVGDNHLSDGSNWGVSKAHITQIRIITNSTDWDLWILQNDNGYSTNDANIPALQIMEGGNGEETIERDFDYEDEDDSDEVHFYFVDNSGSNTWDAYIKGQELQ